MNARLIAVLEEQVTSLKAENDELSECCSQNLLPSRGFPSDPLTLTEWDKTMMTWPGVTTCTIFNGKADAVLFKEAYTRVINQNPPLAGRLVMVPSTQMLQISYTEQEKGCPFDVVKLSNEQESKLSSYTANASAAVVNSVAIEDLFEEFDMKQTQSGTIQIEQKDCLSCMTVFVGETVSVISFSVSHMVADGFAYYRLLKSLDQEYQSP